MSVTIDQQRQRVEVEMTKIIDDLDRTVLRKMQASRKCVEIKAKSCEMLHVRQSPCVTYHVARTDNGK